MQKIIPVLSFPVMFAASPVMAMQAMDEASMAAVAGQSGITIETSTLNPDGDFLTTGEIRYTEEDKDGQGDDYVSIDSLKLRTYQTDVNGNFAGVDTFRTDIDVDAGGNVSIRTSDVDTLDLELGAVSFSGRTLFGAVRFSMWEFVGSSYLETVLLNSADGAKVGFRSVMEEGSGLTYQFDEDNVTFSSDIVFLPADGESTFRSEVFLTGDNDQLKLELGETSGSFEIKNISLLDAAGNNIFGTNNFGDVGYANLGVDTGYFTIRGNPDADTDGILGEINTDLTVGNLFYRTGGQRLNLNNVRLNTNGEMTYTLDFIDTGYTSGVDISLSDLSDLDLTIGAVNFSAGDGSGATASMGSYAVENLNLNGDSINLQLYTLPGAGSEGMQMDLTMAGTTDFDLTITDDDDGSGNPQPQLTAQVVINNFSLSQTIDQTEKGLHVGIVDQSMDLNINRIRMGDGSTQQGQTGRIVMNNISLQPGSYFRVEPLR
ncbi:MAG: hypothetical protein CMI02_07995 [Oceanospirillaceae bacterium]|nr:hypothetical protein [Oceanospirillaceae bacterium]MBT11961.1 hypothetical protein [Oceanospirillaceae bacterium]|tara:strand:- start:81412 stop:82875 length:1464 start_codon:yes stop_codon:yes gene_type:complete